MSYRRKENKHDAWASYRDSHRDPIAQTHLPLSIFQAEHTLVTFLSSGEAPAGVKLVEISDAQFLDLERVVNDYFADGWEQASWTAWAAERLRRFGRYA